MSQLFANPFNAARQAPLSMEFSRKEHWSGLPFHSPGDLPNPGIERGSSTLQADLYLNLSQWESTSDQAFPGLSHHGSPKIEGEVQMKKDEKKRPLYWDRRKTRKSMES